MQDDKELYRHQCEVRQILLWRIEWGAQRVREWIESVGKRRGAEAAQRLQRDAADQWQRGNRGVGNDWRS